MTFDIRQASAILAGLRLLQWQLEHDDLPAGIQAIYGNAGTIDGLDPDEIDDLCEEINLG